MNSSNHSRLQANEATQKNWLFMGGIIALHAALLTVAVVGIGSPSQKVTPPRIIGMLVSDQPAATIDAPKPAEPEVRKTQPTPTRQTPLPPISNAPPSERAIAAPPAAPAPAAPAANAGQVSLPRTDASHLNNPKPVYPASSRRAGEQGRVLLSVYILPDGNVGEIKLKQSSGHTRLDQSALESVRRWRYLPAKRGNEPIPYWYVQPIAFSLDA